MMNVLIAVDGSEYGKWAVEWGARMPWTDKPDVTVLHVIDVDALRAPALFQAISIGNAPIIQKEIKRIETHGKETIAHAKAQMTALKLKGRVVLARAAVGPTILAHATRRDGLVIIGSRGLDALDRLLLGSVSTQVALHAPCSVLVIKEEPRPIQRILLAVDGSKPSEKALRFVLTKVHSDAREGLEPIDVVVTHAVPFLDYPEVKATAGGVVERTAQRLAGAGYVVEEVVRLGKASDEILKVAADKQVDLIVTGAKGQGAIARFLLGSVSTKVLQHSACSVLVVR